MFDSRTDPVMDRFVADFVEGALRNSRANGGPGVNVLVGGAFNTSKFANYGGTGALVGSVPGVLPAGLDRLGPAGAAVGAGLGADPGHGLQAAIGATSGHFLGDLVGGVAGRALGLQPGAGEALEKVLATGGAMAGGHLGGKDRRGLMDRATGKFGSLEARYTNGVKAATAALGIKEAFLPLIGSLLGGTALKKGIGALAGGAGGRMLGGLAGKVAPHMASGIGGAATEMAGSLAGGALGQKLQGPPQAPQGMMG